MKNVSQQTDNKTFNKNCVLYYRVSTDPQETERQEFECLKHCKDNDYTVVKVFQETKSGRKTDRKVLTECLNYIKDNNIHFLIMAEISRLSRSLEGSAILYRLTNEKVCIIGIKEKIKTLNADFTEDRIESVRANDAITRAIEESNNIGYRTSKGKRAKVFSKNIWTGGKYLPYAYQSIDGKLCVDTKEAEIAKDIFQKYYSGWGTVKISNYLNMQNIPTKLGYKWTRTTLNKLLRHKVYIGIRQYNEDFKHVPELQIIDDSIFETCQKRMTESKNINFDFNKRKKYNFMFDKQLLKCQCGKYYYGIQRDGNYSYKCISGKGTKGCGNKSIKKDYIENAVNVYLFKNWYKLLNDNLKLKETIEQLKLELNLLLQEKLTEQKKLERYNELYIEGRYDRAKYDIQYNTSTEQLNKIGIAITKVQTQLNAQETIKETIVSRWKPVAMNNETGLPKFNLASADIDKETLHKVITRINVSMIDSKQTIEVCLINGNTFKI